jgi:DNA replication and repair protein RecF
LLKYGSKLMSRRNSFIREFQGFIASAYHHLVGNEEEPTIEYKPLIQFPESSDDREIENLLRIELEEKAREERRTGTTLVGPHRDELLLKINNLDLRKYASQGQHKTYLIALKVGEFFYLKERCNETPILLLDDIFSELDEHRAEHLLEYVGGLSQTFITSTNPQLFEATLQEKGRNRKFFIRGGSIVEQKAMATA